MTRREKGAIATGLMLGLGVLTVAAVVGSIGDAGGSVTGEAGQLLRTHLYRPIRGSFFGVLLTAGFVVAFSVTLALQALVPARPRQAQLSVGLAQDFVWFFYEHVLHTLVVATYVVWLTNVYADHLDFFTIDALAAWPAWSRYVVALLVLDFLYWYQHYLNHRVPLFWRFHKLHHSQGELNFFTDYRYHTVEYLIRQTVLVIPFLLLQFDVPTILVVDFLRRWYSRFTHGNIRSNLGPLRLVLVTPQSHRVHHGLDEQYQDRNFGAILSIWDHLFGTQVRCYDVYPETGLDEPFPIEQTARIPRVLFLPVVQMAYCFTDRVWPQPQPSEAVAPTADS